MSDINEVFLHEAVSHSVDLSRYGNGVVRRMIALLNRVDRDLFASLTAALDRLPAESFTAERLDALLADVRRLNATAYAQLSQELTSEMRSFVEYEIGYQFKLLESTLPVQVSVASVNASAVYTAAMSRPFSVSKNGAVPLNEYLSGLEAGRSAKIRDALRLGYVEGETISQMVRRIQGTRALNYTDGLMDESRRHVEGMVRTAVNHMSNFTRQSMYEANSDIVKGWMFVATLDGRTSITCASLSGKVFPVGSGPQPPRHINCRSTSTPVTRSFRELGIDIPEFRGGTRASMDGQIASDISFSDWLRGKGTAVQDEILGKTRADLFRANKIEVDRFTDNKGKVLSLEQLAKKDAELFRRAGL